MSDKTNGGTARFPASPALAGHYELVIHFDAMNGSFQVQGPVTNRALCDAMLAGGKTAIEDWHRAQILKGAGLDAGPRIARP